MKQIIIWLGETIYDINYIIFYIKKLKKENFIYIFNGQEISK